MAITKDDRLLYVGDLNGNIYELAICQIQGSDITPSPKKKVGFEDSQISNNYSNNIMRSVKCTNINHNIIMRNEIIFCLTISPDNKSLYIGDSKGYLKQFDIKTKKVVKDLGMVVVGMFKGIELTSDGHYLFLASNRANIVQIDLFEDFKRVIQKERFPAEQFSDMAISPDDKWLFFCGENGLVKQFDIGQNKFVASYTYLMINNVSSMSITKDSRYLFLGGHQGRFKQIDINKKAVIKDYTNIFQKTKSWLNMSHIESIICSH